MIQNTNKRTRFIVATDNTIISQNEFDTRFYLENWLSEGLDDGKEEEVSE